MLVVQNLEANIGRVPVLRGVSLKVAPGQTVNLSNVFVMQPGFLRGNILLQGPLERPERDSLFRGLDHASDNDANRDGNTEFAQDAFGKTFNDRFATISNY